MKIKVNGFCSRCFQVALKNVMRPFERIKNPNLLQETIMSSSGGKKMAGDAVEEVTFGREKKEGDDGRRSAAMGRAQRKNGSNTINFKNIFFIKNEQGEPAVRTGC
jgi:hypothetical protein